MSDLTITADQITETLRSQLSGWEPDTTKETVGYVTAIADGVARVEGLPDVMASELLEFPEGLIGVALNIDEKDLGVVLLGEYNHIEEGDPVKQTGTVLSVPVGDALLGRVVDPLGDPVDGKGPIN
ncbi:MAG TPA: F0F1 ATP synthase subunit alpha, partial [Acidimicrobiia bacterium]